MPTLFISYKRDDKVAVQAITKRLRYDFYFDIWIDTESIPDGEDWRAEIRRGIDKADVVLLMLTPDACASPHVKEEVDYSQSVGRKIVPLQIKRVSTADQDKLGVSYRNYVDFVSGADDHHAWEHLLNSLPRVLARDKRLLDPTFRKLHQDYLRSLFARYGKLSLSYLLEAAPKVQVSLFDVYVPLFLGTLLWGEIKDQELVDWWISASRERERNPAGEAAGEVNHRPKQFPGMVVEAWVLDRIVDRMREFVGELATRENGIGDGKYPLWRLESEEAPALCKHLVITGAPGSGKSTLMKHLALTMAGNMLADERHGDLNQLGFWPLPAYTPVFVELRALVRSIFPDSHSVVTLEKFFSYIEAEQLKPYSISGYLDDLRGALRDGDAMIFLDGLDEVPDAETDERRHQIKELAHLLREQCPACRIVITSRSYAYAGDWQLDGFGQVTLANLDSDRLEELARRLFRVVLGTEEQVKAEADSFKAQMEKVQEALRSSPLFFTLLAAIWLNNMRLPTTERLPATEDAIYRACVEMLIRRWTIKEADGSGALVERLGLTETQLRQVLEALAYQVHQQQGDRDDAEFTGGAILDVVETLRLRRVDIYGLREALAQRAGVIYERAPNRYQYAHRSFQEHLAACYLVADERRYPATVAEHLREQPALWRNVMKLLPDEARQQRRDLWKLVKALLPEKGVLPPETRSDPLWYGLYYAAQLMVERLPTEDDLQEVYRPRLRAWLVRLIEIGALSPVDRAEMGRALAQFGDPCPGVGSRADGLPDIVWADEVPAGKFIMGADDQEDNPRRDAEIAHTFRIAKYPITYAQFQAFIDAPDGFAADRWWADMPEAEEAYGTTYRIRELSEQFFKHANHPRENVTWYQAVAFCHWLTAKYHAGGLIGDDEEIRLPTEQEWERAARGTDGREYPYGDNSGAARSNIREMGIGQTSAVGIFSDGESPAGALDMSGNVWEWCSNKYDEQEVTAVGARGVRRVLRGGSWVSDQFSARVAYRNRNYPVFRNNNRGFRVCLTPLNST